MNNDSTRPTIPTTSPQAQSSKGWKTFGITIGVVVFLGMIATALYLKAKLKTVDTFGKKARQVEAKTMLSMAYVAEKSYAVDQNSYTTDLKALESASATEFRGTHYKIGFTVPSVESSDAGFQEIAAKHCPDCTATKDTFKVVAIGNLDEDEKLDVWTIDDKKILVNVSDDTAD